ncbi:hypothetical protein BKA70DRAFT_1274675 [Coprinopsis sp. MPI-PUGE-AT-0042]|nr:hypothetical protein BKA70DRAFT_1274675 [Coprinopsis sp. MPI-PUGE-AT-0042]
MSGSVDSGAPPPDWNTFLRIIKISQLGLYIQTAATVACIYDHLTTLDLEIELIWKRKISLVQVLYFVVRNHSLPQYRPND